MNARVALAALVLLNACSGTPEVEAPANTTAEVVVVENAVVPAPPPPPPPANVTASIDPPTPQPVVPDEKQVQEDADATGMTSRLSNEEVVQPVAENSSQ